LGAKRLTKKPSAPKTAGGRKIGSFILMTFCDRLSTPLNTALVIYTKLCIAEAVLNENITTV
jgi:hypothetical protein